MSHFFHAMPSAEARAFQAGEPDAYGAAPHRFVSDGLGNPCRHCLRDIPRGSPMLLFAWRPFADTHPYAETGPVFLCAEACERAAPSRDLPAVVASRVSMIIRGYDRQEQIVGGTGGVIARDAIDSRIRFLLEDPRVAFVDLRSASNNCFFCRASRSRE